MVRDHRRIDARLIPHYRPTTSLPSSKVGSTVCAIGSRAWESGMYLLAVFRAVVGVFTSRRRYRPELHYMRGPGPKWFERHGRLR